MSIVPANEQRVQGLQKVASHLFGKAEMDFWRGERGDVYMTHEQLGRALGYSYPVQAIQKLFERNEARLRPNSVVVRLTSTDGKTYDTRVFNEKGVYEIIRWSRQPKADEFYDWVYEVLQTIRKTGSYTLSAPQGPIDERQLRAELFRAALDHEERLDTMEQRIDQVERKVTLDHAEQQLVRRTVAKRVHEFSAGDERRDLFRQLYSEIRDRWGVASYRDVKRVELPQVLQYINAWRPRLLLTVE